MKNPTSVLNLIPIVAALCIPPAAIADPITYQFTMNTSGLAASTGYLEMQFSEPGFVTAPGSSVAYDTTATATVSNFQTDGSLASENPYTTPNPFGGFDAVGDVSGTLPQSVIFSASGDGATNDYSQPITFGNELSFDLTLSGQGVTSPLCPVGVGGTSCSTPDFTLDFYNTAGQYLFTDDPDANTANGWLVGGVSVNADTTTTPFANPGENGVASDLAINAMTTSPVPETPTSVLVATGMIAALAIRWRGCVGRLS